MTFGPGNLILVLRIFIKYHIGTCNNYIHLKNLLGKLACPIKSSCYFNTDYLITKIHAE